MKKYLIMIAIDKRTESLAASTLSDVSLPTIGASPVSNILQRLEDSDLQLLDDNIISWLPGNQNHPRNWRLNRKLSNTACIILLDTFRCVKSCMVIFESIVVAKLTRDLLIPTKRSFRFRWCSFITIVPTRAKTNIIQS